MYIIRGNVYEHPDPSIDGFKEDDSKTTLISKIFNLTKFPSDYELIINELFLDFVLVFIENTYLLKIQYFGFSIFLRCDACMHLDFSFPKLNFQFFLIFSFSYIISHRVTNIIISQKQLITVYMYKTSFHLLSHKFN